MARDQFWIFFMESSERFEFMTNKSYEKCEEIEQVKLLGLSWVYLISCKGKSNILNAASNLSFKVFSCKYNFHIYYILYIDFIMILYNYISKNQKPIQWNWDRWSHACCNPCYSWHKVGHFHKLPGPHLSVREMEWTIQHDCHNVICCSWVMTLKIIIFITIYILYTLYIIWHCG